MQLEHAKDQCVCFVRPSNRLVMNAAEENYLEKQQKPRRVLHRVLYQTHAIVGITPFHYLTSTTDTHTQTEPSIRQMLGRNYTKDQIWRLIEYHQLYIATANTPTRD